MATHPDLCAVAATRLEAKALQRAAPSARVVECGIALSRRNERFGTTVIVCGLAGGLRADLPTGSVIIADRVRRPNGEEFACDRALLMQLTVAARSLGNEPVVAPVLTAATIVHGEERERWAREGFAAADMESGLIVAPRVAVVRVVLDTPEDELSPAWLKPASAMFNPLLWPQALWLARNAPRCARIAASVFAYAFGDRS